MKTIIIILIALAFFKLPSLLGLGVEKLEEKGHTGCVLSIYLVVFLLVGVITVVGLFKSCGESYRHATRDYYEAPRK